MTSIKVSFTHPELQAAAVKLAKRLDLALISSDKIAAIGRAAAQVSDSSVAGSGEQPSYHLQLAPEGLSLLPVRRNQHGPVRCDFTSGAFTHRRKLGGGKIGRAHV